MVEAPGMDASIRRIDTVVTLVGMAALIVVAYRSDRAISRWLQENHPLAGYRRLKARWQDDYQEKRTDLTEGAEFVGDVLVEIARAISPAGTKR